MKSKLNKLFSELPPVVQLYSGFFTFIVYYLFRYFTPPYIDKRIFLAYITEVLIYYIHFRGGISSLKKVRRIHVVVWIIITLLLLPLMPTLITAIIESYADGELFKW